MKKKGVFLKRVFSAMHDDLSVLVGSLLVLMFYELVAITAFFLSISVDVLSACMFVALGFVAVVFKIRARIKLQNGAWFFWAIVTFFGGFMFTINTVVIQGEDAKPEYVIRSENAYQAARGDVDDLLSQQSELRAANRRTAASEMESSITTARSIEDAKQKEAADAELKWESEPKKKIKAIDIFARIPYILKNPTPAILIASGFFIVLFVSVEASVFTIAGEIGKPQEKKPTRKKKEKYIGERFDDVTDEEYNQAAILPDGAVRLPEDVAVKLHITRDEANQFHARLYPGYVYRNDRYVKIETH